MGEPLWLQPLPGRPRRATRRARRRAGVRHRPPAPAAHASAPRSSSATCSASARPRSPTCSRRAPRRSTAACSARARRSRQRVPRPDRAPAPRSPREREIVARFADAFEAGDVDTIVELLTDDAWLTMPPVPLEYQGPAAIGGSWRRPRRRRPAALPLRAHARERPARVRALPAGPRTARSRTAIGIIVLTLDGRADQRHHGRSTTRACCRASGYRGRSRTSRQSNSTAAQRRRGRRWSAEAAHEARARAAREQRGQPVGRALVERA